MCIISVKAKGLNLPKEAYFKNCFSNNADGAGIMYHHKGMVYIVKGLMTYKDFKAELEALKKEIDVVNTTMVFHFRIGTQGGNIPENTHPFPITDDVPTLKKLRLRVKEAMVHNGIIQLCTDKSEKISDTMIFVRDYLSNLSQVKGWQTNEGIKQVIANLIGTDKMVFLNSNDELTTIGNFKEEDGILYSNSTYEWDYNEIRTYYNGGYFSRYDNLESTTVKRTKIDTDTITELVTFYNDGVIIYSKDSSCEEEYIGFTSFVNEMGDVFVEDDLPNKEFKFVGNVCADYIYTADWKAVEFDCDNNEKYTYKEVV